MKSYSIEYKEGKCVCDLPISKEDWLKVLNDSQCKKEYIDTLLLFLREPGHCSTCKDIGEKYGLNSQSINSYVGHFSQLASKILDIQVTDEEGNVYWIIPMKSGQWESNWFVWTMRDELVQALQEHLMTELVRSFEEECSKYVLDKAGYDELYKWKLVSNCQNKDTLNIISNFRNKNIVDAQRVGTTLKGLTETNPEELQSAFELLDDESKGLDKRLAEFKQAMNELCGDLYKIKANDERTASAYLTCKNPSDFSFYMSTVYEDFCKYLGVPISKAGEKYSHYLELLQQFSDVIKNNTTVCDYFANETKQYIQSDLLNAQTILWCKQNELEKTDKQRIYYLAGYFWGESGSQLERFFNEGVWEGSGKQKINDSIQQMQIGDAILLKSCFTKGPNHKTPVIRISAVGQVLSKPIKLGNSEDYQCKVKYFPIEPTEFEGNKYGKYQQTFHKCEAQELIDFANEILENNMISSTIKPYCDLLLSNRNLILTGAPGTGKTYLAKQMAQQLIFGSVKDENDFTPEEQKQFDEQCAFVQFHPSYDYTDFVEGLRPIRDDNGAVGFERRDGVFKEFCKKALKSTKSNRVDNFEEIWSQLIDYLNTHRYIDVSLLSGTKNIKIELNEYGTGLTERTYADGGFETGDWIQGKSKFFSKEQLYNIYKGEKGIPSGGHDNYRKAIVKYMIEKLGLQPYIEGFFKKESESRHFIFIIDEINRGEISKIFGELFFSIDPGYRGLKGKVKTQYQNLVEMGDEFFEGFFVPENVYIIGTMNDIDRSVESMDFAFRRRFGMKEVKADDRVEMLDQLDGNVAAEAKVRMKHLNAAIEKMEGLSSAYHIGPAYFLKLKNYEGDFSQLWNLHLEGLLREYLRGNLDVDGKIKTLKEAYENQSETANESTENNG